VKSRSGRGEVAVLHAIETGAAAIVVVARLELDANGLLPRRA
jgi:hypothetical protein